MCDGFGRGLACLPRKCGTWARPWSQVLGPVVLSRLCEWSELDVVRPSKCCTRKRRLTASSSEYAAEMRVPLTARSRGQPHLCCLSHPFPGAAKHSRGCQGRRNAHVGAGLVMSTYPPQCNVLPKQSTLDTLIRLTASVYPPPPKATSRPPRSRFSMHR